MEKKNKYFHSCGIPIKKDQNGGGSIREGSIYLKYNSYCFHDGNFTQANFSAQEMQFFVKEKMKEIGFPGFHAGFFAKGIPELERWKSNL